MSFSSIDMIIAFSLGLFLGLSCGFVFFAVYAIKKSKYEDDCTRMINNDF